MLKRFILVTTLAFALFITVAPVATLAAQGADITNSMLDRISTVQLPSSNGGKIEPVVARLINAFLSVLGIVFMGLMIYGGYVWMKAQGRDEEVNKAKEIVKAAIIGMAIVFAAYTITYFVTSTLWTATAN